MHKQHADRLLGARTISEIQADHKDLVRTSFKKIDGGSQELTHAIFGIAGEVGELVDAVKKHLFYGKQLDISNVVEELGDIEYYLEALRQNLRLNRSDILQQNITKLERRYPGRKFSEAAAIARADKTPTQEPLTMGQEAEAFLQTSRGEK